MAADLHIHVFEGVTEQDLADFNSNTLGSKYFNPRSVAEKSNDTSYDKICETPQIWIGEVSWLKAALFEDSENFIPSTVMRISELIGEDLPVLDDELIAGILAAFDAPNDTSYSLANKNEVAAFLEQHKGKQVFTVSW